MPEGTSTARRLRPSPAIIISIFALVVAMSSGAYAAVTIAEKNSVVSKSIKNKNVKSADIKPSAVKKKHLASNSVDSSKIVDGQVGSSEIADGSVGSGDVTDGSLGTGDLSAAAKTDLNDASTLGGLTIAQIVAASGGEYVEVIPANAATVATLNIPHAGKWLVNARVPVLCEWDSTGSPDPEPDETGLNQPYFPASATLSVGGTVVETQDESCEAEVGTLIVIVPYYRGTATIEFTRMITTTGPTTVQLKASGSESVFFGPIIPGFKINASAYESHIQAITVQP